MVNTSQNLVVRSTGYSKGAWQVVATTQKNCFQRIIGYVEDGWYSLAVRQQKEIRSKVGGIKDRSCMTYIVFYLEVLSVAEHGGQVSKSPTVVVDLCIYSFGSISFVLCILRLCCLVFIKLVVLYLSVEFILLLLHHFFVSRNFFLT